MIPASTMSGFYANPTHRFFAEGGIESLPEALAPYRPKRVLLVMGAKSFRESEACHRLKSRFVGVAIDESEPVSENPSIPFVECFIEEYRGRGIDLVIGIGGGSAIDAAKVAAVFLTQPSGAFGRHIDLNADISGPRLPLAAVPTTAGTGSEVTPYVSVQTAQKKKITITHGHFFPDLAILDPLLTQSMPPAVTASTGFDALSQAIEAFWSVRHTPFSDTHALRAAALAVRNLATAVREPKNRSARAAMTLAGCESGLAIATTATTAVHSVSYPITTYFHVPHGHACALTLAQFIRYNEDVMHHERYALLWQAMGVSSASQAASRIEKLMEETGLSRSLAVLGVLGEDIETIIQNGFRPDRVKNNPKPLTPEALRAILHRIA